MSRFLWKVVAPLAAIVAWALAVTETHAEEAVDSAPTGRPNVLFIAVDDLNHWVGYTGRNKQSLTPNIDRLSKAGVSFAHAYCAAPACNPSRAALLSGLRPSTSGCYLNPDPWKKYIPEGLGLSAQFKKAGYFTAGAGKIYHGSTWYDSEWDEYHKSERPGAMDVDKSGDKVNKMEGFTRPVAHDVADDDLPDWGNVDFCIEKLKQPHSNPFFVACGLAKPHLPWVVPRKYYDKFPVEGIELPPHVEDDLADIPAAGVKFAAPDKDHKNILVKNRWKEAIRSYLAAIAYTDTNIGRLLDALEKSPHRDNTIICLWGDHGWHLGEKEHWRKFTLWEEAARAPLIIVAPGVAQPGALCERPVEFMSIYPTLCELASVPAPSHVEGKSIASLLRDPKAQGHGQAITTWGYQNHAVRTKDYAYIRYADGSEELYDRHEDPYEWRNLAGDDEYRAVRLELASKLPQVNKPIVKKRDARS